MSLLEVKNLTHGFGEKELYKNVGFELYKGEHMGIVGVNGAGKSTLLKILSGEVIPDEGEIKWQSGIKIGVLDQYAEIIEEYSVFEYLKTSFNDLYEIEEKLNLLYEEMAFNQSNTVMKKADVYQEILENRDFYSIDSTIRKVSVGLGINVIGFDKILKNLSGGQRAKVILAKLLLEQPDLLILDEPTNFLDKEHVDWLSEYLTDFKGAFIIVSHDNNFLDRICGCICDIEFKDIRKYNAGYSQYLKQKENLKEDYLRRYSEQQRTIEKLENYIAKNKVRAATAKMAKGRQKQLDKIDRIEAPTIASVKPSITFKYLETLTRTVLDVKGLKVGYKNYAILPDMNFSINNGEKVVITGFNGIGKSTLLKTIIGQLNKIDGEIHFGHNVKYAYYEQDLNWIDDEKTPIQIISDYYPDFSQKEVRSHLSKCGVRKKTQMQKIKTLSGGEQSKVKLCIITLKECNLLILDEITNHMDELTKEALKESLVSFNGTVVLVSHEEMFYKDFADRIINIS
ncbi:ABC-F family ATP-binding cassette domain-containing protein [Clostridium butyricum]|uniref:ABC-F family ATP-binding cassette domain-containing protein n=1 Tax=Clostridium butyricum TaxID=1492 RepID=UPI003F92BF2F